MQWSFQKSSNSSSHNITVMGTLRLSFSASRGYSKYVIYHCIISVNLEELLEMQPNVKVCSVISFLSVKFFVPVGIIARWQRCMKHV